MFGKRIRLFNLFGFEVKADFSWIVIVILVVWSLSTSYFPSSYKDLSSQSYWFLGVAGALGLFLSIIVHEFSHSYVAKRYGLPMKGITLFIFGGVAEMGDEPPNAKVEFMMALAGPVSSIIIAIIFFGIYSVGKAIGIPNFINGLFGYLWFINALLAGFNLLPAFPLDGGRILRSILWGTKKNLRWATRISSRIGGIFGTFLIIMGVYFFLRGYFINGMWWFLIGMFLNGAAKSSYTQLITRDALRGEPVQRFMITDPLTVEPSVTIRDLVENYIYKYHFKMFPVVQNDILMGCIATKQIKEIPSDAWDQKTVGDLIVNCSPENTISPHADAVQALSVMNNNQASRLMVVDGNRLRGIITLKDMLQFLALKVELEQ
jgi:Zn-dependent protease/CBS domain-containing protein